MKGGKWYNAMMAMSGYSKYMVKAHSDCKLVRKNSRIVQRSLTTTHTCEQAALYMEYNALMMMGDAKKMNGEKFWYHAA